jgi:hypothetical protein
MSMRLVQLALRRRGSVALAIVLTFALAGTTLAAVRGQAWRVGYVETITGYVTGLTANVVGPALQIVNNSTSTAARAIFARSASTSTTTGTIYSQNTGAGPAANFVVKVATPRAAPFTG